MKRRYTRRKTRRSTRASAPATAQTDSKKMSGTSQGDKYILSQADPFDENVDGVKIPDANSQPSVPLKAEDTYDITLGAAEPCRMIGVNPTFVKTFFGGTGATATTWTYAAAYANAVDSNKLTQLRTDFELFRPVAHAVRITSGLAPTAAKGFVHVAVFTMATFGQTTWPAPTSISEMQSVPGYKRIPIGRLTAEGLTVINRPLDCTAQRYVDTDSNIFVSTTAGEFNVPLQWGVILIAVTGVDPGSTPISVENIIHNECIPRSSAVSQATPAARYNVNALAAAANAQSKTSPSALDSEKPARKRSAINHALSALGTIGRGMRAASDVVMNSVNSTPASGGIRNMVSSGM